MPRMSFERQLELETALTDATRTADIFCEWMCQAIGFENREPPKLSEADCVKIYWAVTTLTHLIGEADRIFHKPETQEP